MNVLSAHASTPPWYGAGEVLSDSFDLRENNVCGPVSATVGGSEAATQLAAHKLRPAPNPPLAICGGGVAGALGVTGADATNSDDGPTTIRLLNRDVIR